MNNSLIKDSFMNSSTIKSTFKVEDGLCNLPTKVKRITAGCILIHYNDIIRS